MLFDDFGLGIRLTQASAQAGLATGFRFRIRVPALVEFNDANGDRMFNINEICGTPTRFRQQNWGRFVYAGETDSVKTITGRTTDNLFGVAMHISNTSFTTPSGRVIYPTSAKFDFILNTTNYQWKCSNPATSRLALVAFTKSREFTRTKEASGPATVTTTVDFGSSATPAGFFSWATTADTTTVSDASVVSHDVLFSGLAENTNTNVFPDSDTDSGEISRIAFYSFDVQQPRWINWDPELGYGSNTSSAQKVVAGLATLVALALALLL